MGRFFWLVAMGAVAYAVFHSNRGALENLRDSMLTFRQETDTRKALEDVADIVTRYHRRSGKLPSNVNRLVVYAYKKSGARMPKYAGRDAWGTVYAAKPHREGFMLTSAGPDRCWQTADDVKLYTPFAAEGLEGYGRLGK